MSAYTALSVTADAPRDGVLTLRVAGELDYETDDTFTRLTDAVLDAHPDVGVVLLDCAGLSGIDSMGLSLLLTLRRRLDRDGLALRITRRTARLDRMLRITGTFAHLAGEDEREQAVADAESGPRGDPPRGPAG
ncbi:anti-sigma factor antagonist [Streptomyces sp. NPDC088785]|uniref:anti-sigma factor antagonist n=1 Tax=Streptomyces sp. NPDC088785 TaxID=3365897 RepID=UPI0038208B0E